MFAIDDPSAVAVMPTPEAAGTPGYWTEGNPGLGQPATRVRASFLNMLQQELLNVTAAAGLTPSKVTYNQLLTALNARGVVIGQSRNVRASQSAASASLTITADEVVLKSALGGTPLLLPSFNKTINLATTGAGGMDTGTAPVSGWVGIYAIWNSTTGTSALLATNATAAKAPEVYGGANMPAGYTHSALISVLPTNASSQIPKLEQFARKVYYYNSVYSGAGFASLTSLSIAAAVPKNAIRWWGNGAINSANTGNQAIVISAQSLGTANPGFELVQGYAVTGGGCGGTISDIPIFTPQTMWFNNSTSGNTITLNVYGFEF